MTDEEKVDLIVMLRKGKSQGEVAAHYGVTLSAVAYIEKEYAQGKILEEDILGEELAALFTIPPMDQDFERFHGLYKFIKKVRQLQTMIKALDNNEERATNVSNTINEFMHPYLTTFINNYLK